MWHVKQFLIDGGWVLIVLAVVLLIIKVYERIRDKLDAAKIGIPLTRPVTMWDGNPGAAVEYADEWDRAVAESEQKAAAKTAALVDGWKRGELDDQDRETLGALCGLLTDERFIQRLAAVPSWCCECDGDQAHRPVGLHVLECDICGEPKGIPNRAEIERDCFVPTITFTPAVAGWSPDAEECPMFGAGHCWSIPRLVDCSLISTCLCTATQSQQFKTRADAEAARPHVKFGPKPPIPGGSGEIIDGDDYFRHAGTIDGDDYFRHGTIE